MVWPILGMLGTAAGAAGAAEAGAGLLGTIEGAQAANTVAGGVQRAKTIDTLGLGELDEASGGQVGANPVQAQENITPEADSIDSLGQSRVKYGQQPWEDYQPTNLGMGGY
ncbi:hypothetical protein DRQ25_13485 [Candidatus Fermentibacteria bacterium]|nr:MAG: hypothetical protein DRQ25_13485 [Candidatus Fermentibacteria bacterium]